MHINVPMFGGYSHPQPDHQAKEGVQSHYSRADHCITKWNAPRIVATFYTPDNPSSRINSFENHATTAACPHQVASHFNLLRHFSETIKRERGSYRYWCPCGAPGTGEGRGRGGSHPGPAGVHRQPSRSRALALPLAMQFQPLKISLQVWS